MPRWSRSTYNAAVQPSWVPFSPTSKPNEKPMPIHRQAVPDRPRRHIQKRVKFRFELTYSGLPVNGVTNTSYSTSITYAIWFPVLAVIIMCNWIIERRGVSFTCCVEVKWVDIVNQSCSFGVYSSVRRKTAPSLFDSRWIRKAFALLCLTLLSQSKSLWPESLHQMLRSH